MCASTPFKGGLETRFRSSHFLMEARVARLIHHQYRERRNREDAAGERVGQKSRVTHTSSCRGTPACWLRLSRTWTTCTASTRTSSPGACAAGRASGDHFTTFAGLPISCIITLIRASGQINRRLGTEAVRSIRRRQARAAERPQRKSRLATRERSSLMHTKKEKAS